MFNFKKIASVLTSAVMLSSTIGFAAAASYPAPFVVDGLADAAVVYGEAAAVSDVTAAIDIQQKLGALATSGTATTGASVSGEAAALFTGGTKIYVNDSLNAVINILTDSDLPTVLADESFSGNVDASITQTIDLGSNPQITFKEQPTSSDDPVFALTTSTTQANYIYNASLTFSKAVNFSHADSEGNDLSIFGTSFTVGSATDEDTLILLKSAEKLNLDSDNPSADVVIDGSTYTVELTSSSDTSATIKVTDSSGTSESKEINEAASKKVNGITIAVSTADETNIKLSASIIAGSDKVTLEDGSTVTVGESDTIIDGTLVDFGSAGTSTGNITSLTVSVYAAESDEDAIVEGESFVDPVFGSFKIDFSGFNIPADSTARESIVFEPNSDDKAVITMTDHRGHEKSFTFAKNASAGIGLELMHNDDFANISVREMENLTDEQYLVVGNEDEGYLLRLSSAKNQSSGSNGANDKVEFEDVFSGESLKTTITSEGGGTLVVGGKSYTVSYKAAATAASTAYEVRLNYPDSSGNDLVLYPTIQTEKGARVMFYEPMIGAEAINVSNWDGSENDLNASNIKIPDGDGYTNIAITASCDGVVAFDGNISIDGGVTNFTSRVSGVAQDTATIGQLKFNVSNGSAAIGDLGIYLLTAAENALILNPAVVIFEEKDDNAAYEALIVEVESSSDVGIDTIESTWNNGDTANTWNDARSSDSDLIDGADLFGVIWTRDETDTDQKSVTVSYPDEQIYAQIYVAEEGASITPGSTGGGGGGQVMIVKDSEVSSVASKNLFVVGGSCINTVAAKILGSDSPMCTSAFTDATGVDVNQYIIKTVTSPYSDDKVAMLVAGYEAADTINAVNTAADGVASDVDTEQVYPITATTTEETTA